MSLRRKRRPYRSPDEIALHNAEEALRTEPPTAQRHRKYLTAATAVAICAIGVVGGGMILAADDSQVSDGRNSIPVRVGSGDGQILNSTFVDQRQRVCSTLRDRSNAPIPLLAGASCTNLWELAPRLDSDPAFVTGIAATRRSLVLHGYAWPSVSKVFFRRPDGKTTHIAPPWRPDAARYPGLVLRPFLIRVRLANDAPRTGQVRDHLPDIFCRTSDGTTRVTVYPDLASAALNGQNDAAAP